MERGTVGVTPRLPQLADESFLDYMMTVRNFAIRDWFPSVAGEVGAVAAESGLNDLVSVDEYNGVAATIDAKDTVAAWKRIMRSQQRLTWERLFDAYGANREHWVAMMTAAEQSNPGRLHYDESFDVPASACEDIHLQPGGYCRDNLAGYVFHQGTKVFYQGDNDQDELHRAYVECLREPADGKLDRVLDLGCSIGQCTTELKQKYPDAEVWGLDIGLPLLRYAHMRATDLNVDVHFQQGLAEKLDHADGSFDAVFAYILFHETPEHTFEAIVQEAYRVLRPGGTLTVIDAPNGSRLPAPNRMWLAFDARYNCEPYSPAFVATDFAELVRSVGFDDVEHGPTPTFLAQTLATKPR